MRENLEVQNNRVLSVMEVGINVEVITTGQPFGPPFVSFT
jgi:hypothetical protein